MDIGSDFLDMIPKAQMTKAKITEQNKEKRMKRTEDSLRDLWDNIKRTNI